MKFRDSLPIDACRDSLAENGYAQIHDVLETDQAEALYQELSGVRDWDLAITTPRGPAAIDAEELARYTPSQRTRLMENLRRQSRAGFSFAYCRRDVLPGERRIATDFAQWIQTEAFIATMRDLTGDDTVVRADAHACLYREGHFLRCHDDTYAGKNRRFAYVMNLSRDWVADWGGLLHFVDDDAVSATLVPRFNTLNLFRVPRNHFVSQVATYARNGRLSITGWLFAD